MAFDTFPSSAVCLAAMMTTAVPAEVPAASGVPWRSALYPASWQPDFTDTHGRFLQDFSYAGYHRGESPIPEIQGPSIDVTQSPYFADPTGGADSTQAIQSALDAAAEAGGGVVFLPPGTYLVSPGNDNAALKVRGDRVVLRGAGVGKTFLYTKAARMRGKTLILVQALDPAIWTKEDGASRPLTQDHPRPTAKISVKNTDPFNTGDLVAVRSDFTQRFIDELGMTGKWTPEDNESRTLVFCRRIIDIDRTRNLLTLDVPTRYSLRAADNARVSKLSGHLVRESGIENFSIGMLKHAGSGLSELDHGKPGTAAYDVHDSHGVIFAGAENCWMRRVNSYSPNDKDPDIHVLSNGVKIRSSRFVTVEDCAWGHPQYRGGGGDGYMYTLQGQECLIRRCNAEGGRHNFDFGTMRCSGNVLLECVAKDGLFASDFHMWLSVANLIDNMTCDGDFLEAKYRPWGNWGGNPVHGVTTTQSVFWNTRGLRYPATPIKFEGEMIERPQVVVESRQYGSGYVIGTRGPACAVVSDGFVEGIGQGDSLQPQSLYLDQLRLRLERPRLAQDPQ